MVFKPSHIEPGIQYRIVNDNGGSQPPRKRITHSTLIIIIFAYSPRKNNANPIDEYSTLYPATSSASASGRSNGARFVSARHEIKNNSNNGKSGTANQTSCCASTMSDKFREPTHTNTVMIIKPSDTSYETICAVERNAPKKAYLELLDHPAIITPYTPKEDTAKIYNIPMSKSQSTMPSPNGITAHAIRASKNVNTGAAKNTTVFALLGKTGSLISSFNPSANGCKIPKKPTTFGPLRRCMDAITLRSASVK